MRLSSATREELHSKVIVMARHTVCAALRLRSREHSTEDEVRLDEVEHASPLWGLQGFNSPSLHSERCLNSSSLNAALHLLRMTGSSSTKSFEPKGTKRAFIWYSSKYAVSGASASIRMVCVPASTVSAAVTGQVTSFVASPV